MIFLQKIKNESPENYSKLNCITSQPGFLKLNFKNKFI